MLRALGEYSGTAVEFVRGPRLGEAVLPLDGTHARTTPCWRPSVETGGYRLPTPTEPQREDVSDKPRWVGMAPLSETLHGPRAKRQDA